MKEKKFKELPLKDSSSIKMQSNNRAYGEDWLYTGKSKNYPELLDIRYEKDYKTYKKNKDKKSTYKKKTLYKINYSK